MSPFQVTDGLINHPGPLDQDLMNAVFSSSSRRSHPGDYHARPPLPMPLSSQTLANGRRDTHAPTCPGCLHYRQGP